LKPKVSIDTLPCISFRAFLTLHDDTTGFIQEYLNETNELGMVTTRPKKDKQTKQRRKNYKTQYHFNRAAPGGDKYQEYFDPSLSTENRLLGIGGMVCPAEVDINV
jgi:hypothetical protein